MTNFTFNYNLQILDDLRGAMNENTFLAINMVGQYHTKRLNYQAWGRMCAAIDRLDDTVQYINTLVLGKERDDVAFDFYEFINNAYVVINNIQIFARIFNVDFSIIEKGNVSFNLNCSDSEWFSYVRSLCSVHPTGTAASQHKSIMQNEVLSCCARVVWDLNHRLSKGDLTAIVYNFPVDTTNGLYVPSYTHSYIPLIISQFQNYLQRWLDFIPLIIDGIHQYNELKYDEFRKTSIKSMADCKSDLERIVVLRKEYNLRFGDEIDEIFDFYMMVFQYRLTDKRNQELLSKYKNAIRFSFSFLYNALQHMSFEGYENSGIKENSWAILFDELFYADMYKITALKGYGYHLSKLYLLNSGSYFENERVRKLLEEFKPIANKYVNFSNTELSDETFILMHLVIYLAALESNCLLNRNIPNDLQYRIKLLSESELMSLNDNQPEETMDNNTSYLPDDLKDLFE